MTINSVIATWPKTWASVLQNMYAQGYALCLKCEGLPHENFLEAHAAACPGKV